jgi:hypothetical protein
MSVDNFDVPVVENPTLQTTLTSVQKMIYPYKNNLVEIPNLPFSDKVIVNLTLYSSNYNDGTSFRSRLSINFLVFSR